VTIVQFVTRVFFRKSVFFTA